MKKRRRLSDLYVRGKEVTVDDGSDDPVTVWLQKLNEIERDSILRRANAAKARYMIECDDESSELFVATYGSVREFLDQESMIDLIISEDLAKSRMRFEEEALHDEEGWGKDDKLKRLVDAWTGDENTPGLAAAHAEDPEDPKALEVKAELDRYDEELDAKVAAERKRLARTHEDMDFDELVRRAAHEVLNRRGDEEFMKEWARQQIFYSVREPDDHQKRYFGVVTEVDDLDDQVRAFLDQQCNALFVEPREGKESPASPASSNSSEVPSKAEDSSDSGPVAATA